FRILLDGQQVKTPARRTLAGPSRELAQQLAAGGDAHRDGIDPANMPLRHRPNSIIDGVIDFPPPVTQDARRYRARPPLSCRAPPPAGLVMRQSHAWDPVLAWARETLGARFALAGGIAFVEQPAEALATASSAIPRHPWRLGALHSITTLTGSALMAIA